MSGHARSAADMWQTAYGELQLQLPRETFDTWLSTARLLAYEDGTFVIAVQNIYAREWLEHRLKKVILRTLTRVAERSVEVRFIVWKEKSTEKDDSVYEAGPLLADLAPPKEEPPRFERLSPGETGLNPRQTIDMYAVGACNRMAHAAALAIVDAPAMQFNPLYIHGGVGLGKSHLLHAIGNACAEEGCHVLYVTAETFTNDLVAAIKTNSTADFREKYRDVDVLLVDGIHFLAGKNSMQEEFLHTFDALYNNSAQIVLSALDVPAAIKKLDTRLSSRFEGGLVVELQPPDFLTRVDILENKARLRGYEALSLDVLEMIAEKATGSVRELEGALNRVIAHAMLDQTEPTLAMATALLKDMRKEQAELTLSDIVMAVADYYGVTPDALKGRGRARDVSTARQVAMYLAREEADASLEQIGEALGGRNHSTVLYSCERVSDLINTDSHLRRQMRAIMQSMRPKAREK